MFGSIALTGRAEEFRVGSTAFCTLLWDGQVTGLTTVAADFTPVAWTGRIGTYAVRTHPGEPCSHRQRAGLLLVT